jgi:hypothetical protein
MSTVVVVGAGGSLAHACSFRPNRAREHPPLDGDFFSKATNLGNVSTIKTGIALVRRAIARTADGYDPWERSSVTMEQFFADIYYPVASGGKASPYLPVFIETLRLYRRVLAQTTNWITAHKGPGDLDRLLRFERTRMDGQLTVVTFNHDLLLESVAAKLQGAIGSWCLKSLYGDVDLRNLAARVGPTHQNHSSRCRHSPPFELLKLHGSLNWLMRIASPTPDQGTLFPPRRSTRVIYAYDKREIQIDPKVRATARPGGEVVVSVALSCTSDL